MRMVYTNDNRMLVGNARNLLESAGIELLVKNEFAGGVIGELSAFDAWVELWVVEDADYRRACEILETALSDRNEPDWHCSGCGEINDVAFEYCWRCQSRPPARGGAPAGD